ncbi:hypothetical protein SEA_SERENITY_32 [Mycobacterium phage Serenity]|uniref:hypothetical protein n=1 Tax=Mycobacterium phage Serenity TaxID=1701853 RepID=UPI0006CE2C92|nr:hypothetical protein SEA_SERENITY_32 [Mycobacterium phage Serenity]ALF00900.1 hypothetical protein SEA_SERENITY_32 [Mycobacterium phage Serenity]
MTPDEMYTFAVYYEFRPSPESEWQEVVAVQQTLAEAQAVFNGISPIAYTNENLRNLMLAYTPKIDWQQYS